MILLPNERKSKNVAFKHVCNCKEFMACSHCYFLMILSSLFFNVATSHGDSFYEQMPEPESEPTISLLL